MLYKHNMSTPHEYELFNEGIYTMPGTGVQGGGEAASFEMLGALHRQDICRISAMLGRHVYTSADRTAA